MKYKLVAVESHPIQYKAPLFRTLAEDDRFDLTVLYAMIPDARHQGDGFGVDFEWDVPLLEGYRYEVLENRARHPSVTCFNGCDTPGVYAWLKKNRPDAVLVNGWVVKTCIQTLLACRRLGIPCIVRGEANLLRPRAWWKHACHRLLLRHYSAYLAIGSASRDFYLFHRCPEDRIFLAPYVVDNAWFAREAAVRTGKRDILRKAFGIASDSIVFLFCGKLEPKKRPLDAIRASQQVSASQHSSVSAVLLLVGDGPLMDECRGFAEQHNLPVKFTGFMNQSRLPDAYAAADVLVLPSDAGETWGLVVNEAMASGRAAIVSRSVGCCRDLIIEGKTGFSFDTGDVSALASHLQHYLAEPGLAARQGVAASQRIDHYGFREVTDGLARAVDACLSGTNPSVVREAGGC